MSSEQIESISEAIELARKTGRPVVVPSEVMEKFFDRQAEIVKPALDEIRRRRYGWL